MPWAHHHCPGRRVSNTASWRIEGSLTEGTGIVIPMGRTQLAACWSFVLYTLLALLYAFFTSTDVQVPHL